MIVIGVDVHKQSVTAVAVDEAGRCSTRRTVRSAATSSLGWAAALGAERLWALEDCRHLTRWLERQLLGLGEDVVRVPPKLTVPERRAAGRVGSRTRSTRSRSPGPRCASRTCSGPRRRAGLRELKLLVDHRDDLVDERRRTQQRLRWHLHQLDPTFVVPLRMLGRAVAPGARQPLACPP